MSASLTPMQVMKGAETQTASQRMSASYFLSRPYRHFEKTNKKNNNSQCFFKKMQVLCGVICSDFDRIFKNTYVQSYLGRFEELLSSVV